MIEVRSFIQQIIYIAIVAIIIELILPKGNTKKYVHVIMSLFILLNIISPVINIIRDLDMQNIFENVLENISGEVDKNSSKTVAVFSEYKNEKVTEDLKKELYKEIKAKLINLNVEVKDINIKINDEYVLEKLEVTIGSLDYLGETKNKKILDIMTTLETEYDISSNVIKIIEEDK